MKNTIFFSLSFLLLSISCSPKEDISVLSNSAKIAYNASKMPIGSDGCSTTVARIRTAKGNIDFCFYPKEAPTITNRMTQLIEDGFYDGLLFHRIIPGQIVQTGDPSGKGIGGSNQHIRPEKNQLPITRGSVVMAHDNITQSYDSQFYISLHGLPNAVNRGIVFGQVIKGLEVLEQLGQGDKLISLVLISPSH